MGSTRMIDATQALPGRPLPMPVPARHRVLGHPLTPPWPAGHEEIVVGMGCFWGAERLFWRLPGVWTTAVGYAGGYTPNPTYEEVCSGRTGHAEVVRIVFDPSRLALAEILRIFWESHDPTQGMRQGNDIGTQYRSCIHARQASQLPVIEASAARYAEALRAAGWGALTTEIRSDRPTFYYAEEYHQQYLDRVPNGYCGLAGTGVAFPADD